LKQILIAHEFLVLSESRYHFFPVLLDLGIESCTSAGVD
jgi:hypothetical protein